MFAGRAFWDADCRLLRELELLLAVVPCDKLITVISLTPRDKGGVGGSEICEDEILVSINKSVLCSSFSSIMLMSFRPSDEVSLAS